MDVRPLAGAALAGLAVSTLAACSVSTGAAPPVPGVGSGSTAAPAAGSASAAAVPAPYCAHAPASEVGSTLGLSLGKQVTNLEGPVSVCAYLGKFMVMVRFQSGETPQEFGQSRKSLLGLHQAVRDVAGLGDQAYYASTGTGRAASNTLAARMGTIAVFVTAPTPLGPERLLMKQLLGKI
ncbi:MAG: hypothetical protein ACHP9Z_28545 [Streptosporangiales bacterium]